VWISVSLLIFYQTYAVYLRTSDTTSAYYNDVPVYDSVTTAEASICLISPCIDRYLHYVTWAVTGVAMLSWIICSRSDPGMMVFVIACMRQSQLTCFIFGQAI